MATRTVRLDEESEKLLKELQRATGQSVSALLRHGLVSLRDVSRDQAAREPHRIYEELDLGPGGYALAPARDAKRAIRAVLHQKQRHK